MIEVEFSDTFKHWFDRLRDIRARQKIRVRIDRASAGNFGQVRDVGEGVSELKIDYGQGYRVYFVMHGKALLILLCGGDKSTKDKDIVVAKRLAKERKQ